MEDQDNIVSLFGGDSPLRNAQNQVWDPSVRASPAYYQNSYYNPMTVPEKNQMPDWLREFTGYGQRWNDYLDQLTPGFYKDFKQNWNQALDKMNPFGWAKPQQQPRSPQDLMPAPLSYQGMAQEQYAPWMKYFQGK